MLWRGQTAVLCATGACDTPGEATPHPTPKHDVPLFLFLILAHYFIVLFVCFVFFLKLIFSPCNPGGVAIAGCVWGGKWVPLPGHPPETQGWH